MTEAAKPDTKKPPETPPIPPVDEDEEFWKEHNITDQREKDIIKGRARVLAYHDYRRKLADEKGKQKPKPDGSKPKPWYDED